LYYWALFALEPGFLEGPVESFSSFLRGHAVAA
jgi:hypothetical protein